MISFLITIIKLLAIILAVATFHEFGHFLACKLQGVGVEEFSVGFGPKIFQKKYKGTMYSLRWLPLGGYCAIEGEEQTDENKDSKSSYQNRNALQKIIILSMGVIFNFILALVVFVCVYLPGYVATTQIDSLRPDSVLINAGLQAGDKITSVNGKKVELNSQLSNFSLPKGVTDCEIEYERDGQIYKTTVNNAQIVEGKIGINFENGVRKEIDESSGQEVDMPYATNVVQLTGAGSSAAKVGIKAGDIILAVDNVSTPDALSIIDNIKDKAEKEIIVKVQRGEEIIDFKIVPQATEVFDLGIQTIKTAKSNLKYAFMETIQNVVNVVGSYVKLFTGKASLSNMSGIVGIGEVVSKSSGVENFFYLMAMISMAVGVANILPFPPLDGGKIVIVLIEAIRRKKVSEKFEIGISYLGLGLLLALTFFVTVKDIIRII